MKKLALALILLCCVSLLSTAQKHNFGIVLSGGGALGFAHIGALQALEEHGIYPTIIAGSSMGSLVGSLYAQGLRPLEIYDVVKIAEFDRTGNILAPTFTLGQGGFSSNKNVYNLLASYLPHNSFDSLKMPLYISVTNISTAKSEIINSGNNLIAYLLASSAIPAVFEAVEIDSMYYIDGGTLNNFPAQAIRDRCTILIGIDLNAEKQPFYASGSVRFKDIAARTLYTLIYNNSISGRELCDYVIEPKSGEIYNAMSFNAFSEIYQYGYIAVNEYLAKYPELIKKAKKLNKK